MASPNPRNPRPAEQPQGHFQLPIGGVLLLLLVVLGVGLYVLTTLKSDVAVLKDRQAAIQNDLRDMKTLLQQRPTGGGQAAAPANPVITVADARSKGQANATLTLIEFSDYQ